MGGRGYPPELLDLVEAGRSPRPPSCQRATAPLAPIGNRGQQQP
jgi:hypothetical protein